MNFVKYTIQITCMAITFHMIYKYLGADILFIIIAASIVTMLMNILEKLK